MQLRRKHGTAFAVRANASASRVSGHAAIKAARKVSKVSDSTLSTKTQADGIALINILFLRRKLDRDAAWYAREYGLDKSGDALRHYLASRYVLPEDLAEAGSLFSTVPEPVRQVLDQPALIARYSRERLSDEEQAAVRLVWQWRRRSQNVPKRPAGKTRPSRKPAVPYAATALLIVLFTLAAVVVLAQLPARTELAASHGLRQQARVQTAGPQAAAPRAQHEQAVEVASLRKAIHALQLPCTDPEDTGLREALPEIGLYIQEIKLKNPSLATTSHELHEQLALLEKEYQALKDRYPADAKSPAREKE